MSRLTIIRGLPGAGKSTEAQNHLGLLVEADMYHIDADGIYDWKPENAHKAHLWCQRRVKELLDAGFNVVVANTFITMKELRPYLGMTEDIKIIDCLGSYGSIHNVPEATMARMKSRWISSSDVRFVEYVSKWRLL